MCRIETSRVNRRLSKLVRMAGTSPQPQCGGKLSARPVMELGSPLSLEEVQVPPSASVND